MPIRVLIDIRETDLWRELEPYKTVGAEGWFVEQTTLDVGDIAFCDAVDISGSIPHVVIERKTAEDLGASQKDGRYREQRARLYALRGAGTAIAYLLESPPWSPTLSRSWCRGAFNEVHLQQAMVRLQLRYTIPIFQATSVKDSIQWIRRIAKALVADVTVFKGAMAQTTSAAATAYTEAIHVKKADNNTPERILRCMLLSIPGLGKTFVEAVLIAGNNSLSTIQAMTEEQLSELQAGKRKMGKSLATVIYAALHS
jgi:ERCC4-type nuclease